MQHACVVFSVPERITALPQPGPAALHVSLKSPSCLEADRSTASFFITIIITEGAGAVRQTGGWSGSYWFHWGRALRMALTSSATAVRANSNWSWKKEEV